MEESEVIEWGLGGAVGALARFPAGETVLGPAPFREGLFAEVDRLLAAGQCPDGRFEVETAETRLTCLIHQSAPFLAGLQERDVYSRVPLYEFAIRARQLEDATCSLTRSDNACVLMIGIHFCKRPYLQGSTRLVNPAHVLRVLARQKQDAAMAFEREGARTLLFLNRGEPARLFFGDPQDDPREGTLSDRILLWAFADSAPPSKVEVFTNLKLPADRDRGTALAELAESTRPCPPATVFVHMADGREIRRRPFLPPAMVIGRDSACTLFIDNLAVSRQHARLSWERGRFVIEDLDSANGTWLKGTRVSRAPFSPGDRIEVGKFRISLVELTEMPTAPETLFLGGPPRPQAAPPAGYLVSDQVTVQVATGVLLGRGEGVDVPVKGLFVSPVHARVTRDDQGAFHVRCFGNKKVRVNGRKVASAPLRFGDELIVGRSRLSLVPESDTETAAVPRPVP